MRVLGGRMSRLVGAIQDSVLFMLERGDSPEEIRQHFADWAVRRFPTEVEEVKRLVEEALEGKKRKTVAELKPPRWLPEEDLDLWNQAVERIEREVGVGKATYPAVVSVYKAYKKRGVGGEKEVAKQLAPVAKRSFVMELFLPPTEDYDPLLWKEAVSLVGATGKSCYSCVLKAYKGLSKRAYTPGPLVLATEDGQIVYKLEFPSDEHELISSFRSAADSLEKFVSENPGSSVFVYVD